MPIGSYAAKTGTAYQGYAMPGFVRGLNGAIPINHSHWGPEIMYFHYSNQFDYISYSNNVPQWNGNGSESGNFPIYIGNLLMGGIFYTYNIKYISFDFKIMTGLDFCQFPGIDGDTVVYISGIGAPHGGTLITEEYGINPSTSTVFVFDLGGEIRFNLQGEHFGLLVNTDFIYSNAIYHAIESLPNAPLSEISLSGHIPILQLMLQGGIFYRIGR